MDINLSIVTTIVLFVWIFDALCDSPWFLNGILLLIYTFIYIYITEKVTLSCKTCLHDLVMYLINLLYRGKRIHLEKPLLFVRYINRNNTLLKTPYFNLCLMVDLLSVIYKCLIFHILLFYVRKSVRSDPFLSYYVIFIFFSLLIKLQ